jgi:hypothetical protein
MKIRRVRASEADPAEYIAGANEAFGHWGDEALFAWAFRGGELLFLDDDAGRVIAGSGINYRTLVDGREIVIISGAWTAPAGRGVGAFTRLIEATHEVARERDAITIAFGRMDNVSRVRLAAAGAEVHPTFYCRSAAPHPPAAPSPRRAGRGAILALSFPSSFRYTAEEWRAQFIERPHAEIECLGDAIVERTADFDRVHAVSDDIALPMLIDRAHAAGRRLFWFTLRKPSIACEWTDGFLTTFPPTDISGWELQNGDRM